MIQKLLQHTGAFVRAGLAGLALFLGMTGLAQATAPSYCTAVYGIVAIPNGATTGQFLRTFNVTTGKWNTVSAVAAVNGNANALSGAANNGLLYYINRTDSNMYVIDPGATTPVSTLVGTVPAATPTGSGAAFNYLGATADPAGNLFVYGTDGTGAPTWAAVAQVSISTGATVTSWTQVRTQAGATPTLAGSGDIFFDTTGQSYIVSNTVPPTYFQVNLTPGSSFGVAQSPAFTIGGIGGTVTFAGASVNPATGIVYLGSGTSGSITYSLSGFGANGTVATILDTASGYSITDMGNCSLPTPNLPTVTKTFSPVSGPTNYSTSTLTINIGNSNLAPIYLNLDFKDVLPTNMKVTATTGLLTAGCGAISGNTVTATIGSNSITFSAPGKIPVGGCTMSVTVTGSATGSYVNTIAAGSLTTSVGTNSFAATALYLINTRDFSITKTQAAGVGGSQSSAALSIAAGQTLQYVLTIANSGSSQSSGTVTFTDTLPVLITPVLSVVAVASGGGNCTTATTVVTGITTITGTFIAAPAGAQCVVTVTAKGSASLTVSTSVSNSATITGTTVFPDSSASNNVASVATTINPAANLSITKTNNVTSLIAGQTTSYTISAVATALSATVTNAMVTDAAVTGLNCTSLTCSASSALAVCPTTAQTSIVNLQSTGVPVTFGPGSSTASFVITCGVTATGQ